MKNAVLFGSIGSIVESSEIQRRAYNQALSEAGLSWNWDRETYADLLTQAGGRERLAQLSAATGAGLSEEQIKNIHERKTAIACEEVRQGKLSLRPGVAELIKTAKSRGMKLALVTTTYQENIDAIFAGLGKEIQSSDFDVIVSRADVQNGKPAPDAYRTALQKLNIAPENAVAIEDTANSVMSAKRAGVMVIATPGDVTRDQDFWQADVVLPSLAGANGTIDSRVAAMLN